MSFTWQDKSSFLFGTTDMYQTYGISIAENGMPNDVLMPTLRPRKVVNPLRSGAYDYGAHYYDERTVQIRCVTVKAGTRDDAREMAYTLSKKSQIHFWNEPSKYYVGRVYEAPSLDILRKIGNQFTLTFVLEPFAYGETLTEPFVNRMYNPQYKGTASTPTTIIIENTGTGNAVNITITQTIRKEN